MNNSFNKTDYLSLPQTAALKGILAICVLLCHTIPASKVFYGNILSPLIGSLGYLSVSVFFFLSGYGIMTQYSIKKEKYLHSFLKRRVLSIYLLTVFLIAIYWIFHRLLGQNDPLYSIISSFLIGNTIVSNGWYLQVIVLFYLIWYLCVYFIRIPKLRSVALGGAIILYMFAAALLFSGSTWYECSLSFILGMLFQQNRERIEQTFFKTKHRYIRWLILVACLFAGFYVAVHITYPVNVSINGIIRIGFKCLSSPLFCMLVILVLAVLNLEQCRILRYLGKISIEIYVLQGIPLALFRWKSLCIEKGWLYNIVVIASTIILAVAMHPLIHFIMKIPQKLWRNEHVRSIQ